METIKTTARVAVYTRISDDSEGLALGVQRQEHDCRERIEDTPGWVLHKVYAENDKGASTRSTSKRPVYKQLLDDAKAGKFDVILAYSTSRLTRRPLEFNKLIALSERTGVQVVSISDNLDLTTSSGRFAARVMADKDAADAERTGELVARKQAQKRAAGHVGTKRTFGWAMAFDANGHRLPDVLRPDEGPALVTALQMIRGGKSVGSVARYWNDLGLTTVPSKRKDDDEARGRTWTSTRTKDVLLRWRNAGLMEHLGNVVGEGTWEPACTPEELHEVRALLSRPRGVERKPRVNDGKAHNGGRLPSNLLSNIAMCGKCGRPLFIGRNVSRRVAGTVWYDVYRCSGSQDQTGNKCYLTIRKDVLEGYAVTALRRVLFFSPPTDLVPTDKEANRVSELSAERAAIVEEERQIGVALGARNMSVTAAMAALDGLSGRVHHIDAEIEAITSRFPLRTMLEEAEGLFDRAAKIAEEYNGLDLDQRRALYRALFTITVEPGRDAVARTVIVQKSIGARVANEWHDEDAEFRWMGSVRDGHFISPPDVAAHFAGT